ncbi:MAG: cytidylate kinase family protein [candidate division NC10 bacterium]|nr:cytidylate kinase family protein [candidate division NC10 bacterium]
MTVVAMTRERGSLGTTIGMDVAKRLGYEFVQQDITRLAAQEFEVSEEDLIRAVEERPGFFERLGHAARKQFIFLAAEVFDFAARGGVVIMGRFSTLLLRPVSHVLTVRVCAPLAVRLRRVMERHATGRERALRIIKAYDDGVRAQRAEFRPTDASRQHLADLHLAARVKAVLKARPETTRLDVDVRTEAGRVTLLGTVPAAREREAAERVSRTVAGVRDLHNQLIATTMPAR